MEKYEILRNVFKSVTSIGDEALNELLKLFSPGELDKSEYFVEEGIKTSDIIFITEGVIRAFYRTPQGVEYNKTFFVENSFAVSLSAVLQKAESYLNFQALTDCKFLKANYYEMENLYPRYHKVETLVRIILQNEWVIKKELRELRLVLNDAEERYKYFQLEYPGLENRIPQYHIASHLGVTPIQLSRIRSEIAKKRK